MAHFLGSVQGGRGEATRLGTPKSGIDARAQGWNTGIRVAGRVENGADVFYVFATGGSGGNGSERLLATVSGGLIEIGEGFKRDDG